MSKLSGIINTSKIVAIIVLICFVGMSTQAQDSEQSAAQSSMEAVQSVPLYLYYFETDDELLTTGETQQYQFTAFRGEKPTIAVYGLDQLVMPQLTLRDAEGNVVATGRSTREQPYVRLIQFTAPQDQLYTFDVTAAQAAERGGLVRVMLVEGDPIDGDLTYLDTVNPLLPGRVFMVSGSDEIEDDVSTTQRGVRVRAEVLPVDRFRDRPDIFVSRGAPDALPIIEERFNPATSHEWFNEGDNKFYFFTVHAIPERITSATREVEYEAFNLLTFFYFDYFFSVGAGGEPISFGQETQPCSDVTLENRKECERTPTQHQPVFEKVDETEAEEVELPPTPPSTEFREEGCYIEEGYSYYHGYYYHYFCYDIRSVTRPGDNTIFAGLEGTYEVVGGAGDDIIYGSINSDAIYGDDFYSYSCASYNYFGYVYDYTCYYYYYYYGTGNDQIYGGNGNDFLVGSGGNDIINGDNGDDTIYGDSYEDFSYCNYHYDWTDYYSTNYQCSISYGWYDTGVDQINGGAGGDYIVGGGGDDIIEGGGGYDYMYGDGNYYSYCYNYYYHQSSFSSCGSNTYELDPGNDTFIENQGSGSDYIDGQSGFDTVNYSDYVSDINFTITDSGSTISATSVTNGETDNIYRVEIYITGSGNDNFNVSGTFSSSNTSDSIQLSGSDGNDRVTFAAGTNGYFTLIGIELVRLCSDATCAVPVIVAGGWTDGEWYLIPGTSINICVDPAPDTPCTIPAAAPLLALSSAVGTDVWELTTASATPVDGGVGSDTYRLAEILGININDTGTSGTDTVVFAVENAALTIEALSETSYNVSSATNTIFLDGIENVTTGAANDIFLLDYDTNGVSNVYDAGDNADATDRDIAIIQSDLDLTLDFSGNSVNISETGNPATTTDTLMNFEVLRSGTGNDTFVMGDGLIQGFELDGDAGLNSILYDSTSDLTVNLVDNNVMNVTDGLLTDTLSNFSSITTGDGDDAFNLDINAASTTTAYNFNAGGGNNIFRFFFDGDNPLTDTVAMSVGADGANNVLDFTGVDVAVNIDLDLRTPQEIFENFIITLEGVFEAVFNPDVQNLPDILPPELETEAVASDESTGAAVTEAATEVPVEGTETATEPAPENTNEVTEATPEPTVAAPEPTSLPPVESTHPPETTQES